MQQDYNALQILISDNASSDSTGEICRNLTELRRDVEFIRHAENRGATWNFNYLLDLARGDYFMWLGDDDWLDENYVSECVRALECDPSLVLVAGQPKYYLGDQLLYQGLAMNLTQQRGAQRLRAYFCQVQHNGIFYGLYRTSILRANRLKHVMGGDILLLSSVFLSGSARTLDNTCLHRRRGGISIVGSELARSMGLPWLDRRFPRLSLARNVWWHFCKDPAFRRLGYMGRRVLAVQCILLAFARKSLTILFPSRFIERAGIPKSL